MTGGPIVLTVEMTGEMTSTRSYNVRENDRRFDQWTNSSVDPSYLMSLSKLFTYDSLVHAIAGATGSTIAISSFYPFETARVRLQVDEKRKAQYSYKVIAEIYQEEGLQGLYRGWLPVVTSICTSNFIYFYTFNGLKAAVYSSSTSIRPSAGVDLLLGLVAGSCNVLLTNPLWVANTRMKLQGAKLRGSDEQTRNLNSMPVYNNIFECVLDMYRKESLKAMWSGVIPSLLLTSNPAIHFAIYEALKRFAFRNYPVKELSSLTVFLMGACAKLVATFLTYPLQIVQTKFRAGQNKSKSAGIFAILRIFKEIVRKHGLFGLFKGLEAKLTQTLLMAALMFMTYEKITYNVFKLLAKK